MDLREVGFTDPETHWYYQSKLKAISQILSPYLKDVTHIMDVGAGSGFFSRSLVSLGHARYATCIDSNYKNDSTNAESGVSYLRMPPDNRVADLYLFMDVLEHVQDDLGLLQDYVNESPPRSLFLVTVPAFKYLWGKHDVFLGHYRRYSIKTLNSVVERTGLEVVKSRYLYASLVPVRFIANLLDLFAPKSRNKNHLSSVPDALNSILQNYFITENSLLSGRKFGLTVALLAIKS